MFQMCGVFAEFERGILSESLKAELRRAGSEGKVLAGLQNVSNIREILEDKAKGMTGLGTGAGGLNIREAIFQQCDGIEDALADIKDNFE